MENLPICQLSEKTEYKSAGRLVSLDILKAFAAMAVIVNHISWTGISKTVFLYRFWISPAVPIFITITAFLYSRTMEKTGFVLWYSKKNFYRFAKRFVPAALLILVFEFCIEVLHREIRIVDFIRSILVGGLLGPGGYYVSILLQLIIIFPFVFKLARWKPLFGFVFIILLNICYELIPTAIVTDPLYRILIFRYSVSIYLGIILYLYFHLIPKTIIPAIALFSGIVFFTLREVGYTYTVFNRWRESFSIFPGLYSFAVVFYFIHHEMTFHGNTFFKNFIKRLAIFGSASYHIFLSQMFYFLYVNRRLMLWLDSILMIENNRMICFFLEWVISVSICLFFGVVWFKLENLLIQYLDKRVVEI